MIMLLWPWIRKIQMNDINFIFFKPVQHKFSISTNHMIVRQIIIFFHCFSCGNRCCTWISFNTYPRSFWIHLRHLTKIIPFAHANFNMKNIFIQHLLPLSFIVLRRTCNIVRMFFHPSFCPFLFSHSHM